jgi:hypothetical protein
LLNESKEKMKLYESALINYPNTDINLLTEIETLKTLTYDCEVLIWGDRIKSSLDTETYPSISSRISKVKWQLYSTTSGVTKTMRENKKIAEEEYAAFRIKLDDIIVRLKKIEKNLDDAKIPYIKGKDEKWKEE